MVMRTAVVVQQKRRKLDLRQALVGRSPLREDGEN